MTKPIRRSRGLDGRVVAALRAVAGAPPAETVDWWSLRRRIGTDAGYLLAPTQSRRLLDGLMWWRAMVPVGIVATLAAAFFAVGPSVVSPSGTIGATADSTDVAAWVRSTVAESENDDAVVGGGGRDAWLAAALGPTVQ